MKFIEICQEGFNRIWESVGGRRLILAGSGLLICCVVVNLLLGAVFWHRLYPNSRVGGQAVGALSYSAVPAKINQLKLLPTAVALQQPGHSDNVPPKQLGIQVDTSKITAQARQRSWLPLWNLFSTHDTSVSTVINRRVLVHKLSGLAADSKQGATNARIVIQNNQFVLDSAANGSQIDVNRAVAVITQAVNRGQRTVKLPMTAIAPAVTAASLQANLKQLQAQQAVSLSYVYNNKTTKASPAEIAGWYVQNGNSYSLSTAKIQAYITGVGTANGIRLQNLAQAVSATQAALQNGKTLSFALSAVPPGVCANNNLSQLVVVSISQQHMWACESYNQVYDTAVTTGAYQAGTPTPTGTWRIYAKQRNINLTGPTWDDFVSYWLPFYTDYGFHDASWQLFPFGDPAYASQGSHGCVHLPTPAMAWLYGWSRVGTTVTIAA